MSVPAEYSPAWYRNVSVPSAVTEPFSGLVSRPTSWTESPSGSIPVNGIATSTVPPESTRAVTVFGTGGLLVLGSASRTEMRTSALEYWPSGAFTRYTAVYVPGVVGAR
nr:hypothetical protein [Cryobacterium breve]